MEYPESRIHTGIVVGHLWPKYLNSQGACATRQKLPCLTPAITPNQFEEFLLMLSRQNFTEWLNLRVYYKTSWTKLCWNLLKTTHKRVFFRFFEENIPKHHKFVLHWYTLLSSKQSCAQGIVSSPFLSLLVCLQDSLSTPVPGHRNSACSSHRLCIFTYSLEP